MPASNRRPLLAALLLACAAAGADAASGSIEGRLPTFEHEGRKTNGLVYENGEVKHVRGEAIDHTHWETPGHLMTHHKELAELLGGVSASALCNHVPEPPAPG